MCKRFGSACFYGSVAILLLSLTAPGESVAPPASTYFKIQVVDDQTGRGVPLVELKTTNSRSYWTDSNGLVAFYEPGLMDQKVFFHVGSHGYEYPKDGFGYAGVALDIKPGGSAEIKVKRRNIAERLYRITGEGIYNDSVLLGLPVPIRQPVLNGLVVGQDSVVNAVYQGKIYWFWGDTGTVWYPLGLFRASGATSELPGSGGLDPAVGVNLTYFVGENGFSRAMCPMPEAKEGVVWLDGALTVADEAGRERMVCHYARLRSLDKALEHGLAIWDDQKEIFVKAVEFDMKRQWQCLGARPIVLKDGRQEYCVFPHPFPLVRVRRDLVAIKDQDSYQAFTPLAPGTRYEKAASKLERDQAGHLVWGWKAATDPLDQAQEKELIAAGLMNPDEARYQIKDVDTGLPITVHGGTLAWNDFRHKWIIIALQIFGSSSVLGEVYFAEADVPAGPWLWARKIVTHDRYSFYNVAHHPFFDQQGGRIIYFEGTYTAMFSRTEDPTPRYDYNQVMYRLDLADARLAKIAGPTSQASTSSQPSTTSQPGP